MTGLNATALVLIVRALAPTSTVVARAGLIVRLKVLLEVALRLSVIVTV